MTATMETVSAALRPTTFDDYIGQEKLKERLRVVVAGAIRRHEPLPHMLFLGPPGVGKTTIAAIVANMVRDPFAERRGALDGKALLNLLWREMDGIGSVFLDEIHTWSHKQQTILLPLLEDGKLDTPGGPCPFPWITVMAGTTERGAGHRAPLLEPLLERFGVPFEFEPYSIPELGLMMLGMADRLGTTVPVEVAVELAEAAGGSTRTLRYLLMTYRNLTASLGREPQPSEVLGHVDISADGLTRPHRECLRALDTLGGNGGVDRIALVTRMDRGAVHQYGRLLMDRGFVIPGTGSQGLVLTMQGRQRLGQEKR